LADSESMECKAHRTAAVSFYYRTEFFIFMWFPTCKTTLGWKRRFEAGVSNALRMVLLKLRVLKKAMRPQGHLLSAVHASLFGKNLVP
jgi:hypothetical protein